MVIPTLLLLLLYLLKSNNNKNSDKIKTTAITIITVKTTTTIIAVICNCIKYFKDNTNYNNNDSNVYDGNESKGSMIIVITNLITMKSK